MDLNHRAVTRGFTVPCFRPLSHVSVIGGEGPRLERGLLALESYFPQGTTYCITEPHIIIIAWLMLYIQEQH
jgi:hypothetical protein